MSDNKKYYYLKLKDNFFETDGMIVLESMQDGYLYSNILLKLYLRSLKYEGKLMFNDRIPYNPSILAQVTRHKVGVVEKALKIFVELDLIDILDNGAIFMTDIQNYIGKSSTEADRKRDYRHRIEVEKTGKLLTNGQMSDKCPDKTPPEIDIELEKELKIEKEIISDVVDYLNSVLDSKYRKTSTKTKDCIKARLNEGFTVEDFKKVIDIKYKEWNNTEYAKYLRPETLFSNKFEGYLNQPVVNQPKTSFGNHAQHENKLTGKELNNKLFRR